VILGEWGYKNKFNLQNRLEYCVKKVPLYNYLKKSCKNIIILHLQTELKSVLKKKQIATII